MQAKQSKHVLLVSILLPLCFSAKISADHHPHQHEKMFAASAGRHELVDAYLSKCAEVHHLAHKLEEVQNDGYHWKDIKKAFGVGAVIGVSVSAIAYIITR